MGNSSVRRPPLGQFAAGVLALDAVHEGGRPLGQPAAQAPAGGLGLVVTGKLGRDSAVVEGHVA